MRNARSHGATGCRAAEDRIPGRPMVHNHYVSDTLIQETDWQEIAGEPVSKGHMGYSEDKDDISSSTVLNEAAEKNSELFHWLGR